MDTYLGIISRSNGWYIMNLVYTGPLHSDLSVLSNPSVAALPPPPSPLACHVVSVQGIAVQLPVCSLPQHTAYSRSRVVRSRLLYREVCMVASPPFALPPF